MVIFSKVTSPQISITYIISGQINAWEMSECLLNIFHKINSPVQDLCMFLIVLFEM